MVWELLGVTTLLAFSLYLVYNGSLFYGSVLFIFSSITIISLFRIKSLNQSLKPKTKSKKEHLEAVKVATTTNPYFLYSATELAELIRTGKESSEKITAAHVAHIKAINPHLNAVVAERFQEAMKEAKAADQAVKKWHSEGRDLSSFPPLWGVPCTIKECFALKGMPNSSGLVARKSVISVESATAVQRYLDAGAIPLGVTNVSELCMWYERKILLKSNNKVYGRTRNPYNPTKMVGGSSGGEGAIIGSGASPFGLGSDIGGSIRMPAFFNGVFGHKPSGGLVPGTGQYPIAQGEALTFLSTGPLCRKAKDLALLTQIVLGPDGKDSGCEEFPHLRNLVKLKNQVDVKKLTVYYLDGIDNWMVSETSKEMKEALRKVTNFFQTNASEVIDLKPTKKLSGLKKAVDIWSSMLHEGNPVSFKSLMANGDKNWYAILELIKWGITGHSPYTIPALALCLVEKLPDLTPSITKKLVNLGRKLRNEFEELLGDNAILLFPSHPYTAPSHGKPLLKPTNWIFTGIWNMMLAPGTQVPLGLDKKGLPLGVQVIAKRGNDHLTIAVAEKLEEAFGGWVPPSLAPVH